MEHYRAYQIAEEKIAEAKRTGAKVLDLGQPYLAPSFTQLSELPASLFELSHLESLNLDRNQLTHLPDSLAQLTQLQKLSLDENQ